MRGVGDRRLLELVVETFALGDLERFTEPLVVGAEAEQSTDERLVGAMAFAGPRKGAVQLEKSGLGGPTEETSSEQSSLHAPAVCEEEGPTMTGPIMSSKLTI